MNSFKRLGSNCTHFMWLNWKLLPRFPQNSWASSEYSVNFLYYNLGGSRGRRGEGYLLLDSAECYCSARAAGWQQQSMALSPCIVCSGAAPWPHAGSCLSSPRVLCLHKIVHSIPAFHSGIYTSSLNSSQMQWRHTGVTAWPQLWCCLPG